MSYQNHKYKLLFTSILFLLLGIAFMVYPANSMIMLVRITGCFLIILGILIIIPTLRDRQNLGIRFGLLVAISIIIAIFGVILLTMPGNFVKVFWITMGIILILDGIKNLMYLGFVHSKLINIILSAVSIICGVLILTHPFGTGLSFIILIGAFYAYSGAAGIALSILTKIKKRDIVDEFRVVDEHHADPDEDVIMIDTASVVDEAEGTKLEEVEVIEPEAAETLKKGNDEIEEVEAEDVTKSMTGEE